MFAIYWSLCQPLRQVIRQDWLVNHIHQSVNEDNFFSAIEVLFDKILFRTLYSRQQGSCQIQIEWSGFIRCNFGKHRCWTAFIVFGSHTPQVDKRTLNCLWPITLLRHQTCRMLFWCPYLMLCWTLSYWLHEIAFSIYNFYL